MSQDDQKAQKLKHELGNAKAREQALKGMLGKASNEIEHLAEADCADEQKEHALKEAEKFRRAASL